MLRQLLLTIHIGKWAYPLECFDQIFPPPDLSITNVVYGRSPNCSGRLEFQLEAPSLIKTFVTSSSFWVVQKRLGATHILKVKPQIEDALPMNTRHHAHVRPITAKQRVCCRTYSFGGTLDEKPVNRLVLIDLCAILCHNTTNKDWIP